MNTGTLNKNFYRTSLNGLGDALATLRLQLTDAQNSLAYWEAELARYPDSTNAQSQVIFWKARAAAIQRLISSGQSGIQRSGQTQQNEIENWTNQYVSSLTKLVNQQQNNGVDLFNNLSDTITTDFAGLPLWAWLGIATVGIFLFVDTKKKYKKA